MIDDRNPQTEPSDDPELDALFASTGEFSVPPDLERNVMRVVALPLPAWAVRVRSVKQAMFSTRLGRVAVAGVALAGVTSITMMVRFFSVNGRPVREGLGWWARQFGLPRFSIGGMIGSFASFLTGLVPAGLTTRSFALIASLVVGVSAVGLYVTAGPPALRSRHAR